MAYASFMSFKLFQMEVKSAFLNGILSEEVSVKQPPGLRTLNNRIMFFKMNCTLYGLKQASRAWYERLSKFLLENPWEWWTTIC